MGEKALRQQSSYAGITRIRVEGPNTAAQAFISAGIVGSAPVLSYMCTSELQHGYNSLVYM